MSAVSTFWSRLLTPTIGIILTVTEHTTMVTIAGGGHGHCLYLRSSTFRVVFRATKDLVYEMLDY
jgi:hypothetical protein